MVAEQKEYEVLPEEIARIPAFTVLGPITVDNCQLADFYRGKILSGTGREITPQGIFETTGIEKRYRLQPLGVTPRSIEETVPRLAIELAEGLMLTGKIDPADLDYVFNCTSYPMGEKISGQIKQHIQADCASYDVYAACSGPGYLLYRLAEVREQLGEEVSILLTAVEHYSAKIHELDLNNSIFSDGATAVVLRLGKDFEIRSSRYIFELDNKAISMPIDYSRIPHGSLVMQNIPHNVHFFKMHGPTVLRWFYTTPIQILQEMYTEAINGHNGKIQVVTHQGSGRIIRNIKEQMTARNIDASLSAQTVEKFGNLASGSSLAEFAALINNPETNLKKGDKIIFMCFGAGLAVAAVTLEVLRDLS